MLFIGPSTGAAHPPLGIGENGRGMGTLALTLKEESRRDLNFLSAHFLNFCEEIGNITQTSEAVRCCLLLQGVEETCPVC